METNPTEAEIAWLAGLFDGEGSIGINKNKKRSKNGADFVLFPQVQIQMTHVPTIERVVDLLHVMGCRAVAYHWAEKKTHHKDACGVRVVKTGYVHTMATAFLPYTVTKLENWLSIKEFCELRIERVGLQPSGELKRGGRPGWWIPYSDRELELYEHLARINRRGKPAGGSSEVASPRAAVRERMESKSPSTARAASLEDLDPREWMDATRRRP